MGSRTTHLPMGGNEIVRSASHQPSSSDRHQIQEDWDAVKFKARLQAANATGNLKDVKAVLKEVAKANYALVQKPGPAAQDVARTDLVSRRDAQQRVQGTGRNPVCSISKMSTGDALLHFAKLGQPTSGFNGSSVCGMNFANGQHVGGGYLHGARAQEEDLCRQFPALYTSLVRAKDYGRAYPYGPCTYRGDKDVQRYSDVLFTPRLVPRRASQAEGYRMLVDNEIFDNISLVSAAAPNLKDGEVFDPLLVLETMRSVFVVPKLKDRRVDTLVLGAWGCGAFACDPKQMASLFGKALLEDKLGRLYKEVHFAIPVFGDDTNFRSFEETLRACGVNLVHVD